MGDLGNTKTTPAIDDDTQEVVECLAPNVAGDDPRARKWEEVVSINNDEQSRSIYMCDLFGACEGVQQRPNSLCT
jgi:hypothetical protein